MVDLKLKSSRWNKAAYLNERACNDDLLVEKEEGFDEWKEVGAFKELDIAKRIQIEQLNENQFKKILQQKHDPLLKSDLKFESVLQEIYEIDSSIILDEQDFSDDYLRVFPSFYKPFLRYAKQSLTVGINKLVKRHEETFLLDRLVSSILNTIHSKLVFLSFKTLISELHIAKLTDQLEGDTPTDRYQFFEEYILNDPVQTFKLLELYPVLARLMVEVTTKQIQNHIEAMTHFVDDYKKITQEIPKDYAELVRIQADAGDSHQDGRTVMMFRFASGSSLVYKPRSLAIDIHFNQLIEWVNRKGFQHALISAKSINCGTYGWQEFIEATSCVDQDGLNRFYYRQGGYIALFYMLGSVDFHYENVIASGEHPVLIDLETLFHQNIELKSIEKPFLKLLTQEIRESVLSSAMLPFKFSTSELIDFDLSGLGGEKGQESKKVLMPVIEDIGTDEMHLTKKPVVSQGSLNVPRMNGDLANAADHADEIQAGFQAMYQILLQSRNALFDHDGPIYAFANDKARHVIRATEVYSRFLLSSTHPDYLQNGIDRVKLFDHLWGMAKHGEILESIIPYECTDLLKHDIPYFTFRVNSTSIFTSNGEEIPSFYAQTAMDVVSNNIKRLSDEDMEKQLKYMHMSLDSLSKDIWDHREKRKFDTTRSGKKVDRKIFLTEAIEIGNNLVKNAIWNREENYALWIAPNLDSDGMLRMSPLGPGLYDGIMGLVVFLAQLAKVTEKKLYKNLAQAALKFFNSTIKTEKTSSGISAFNGNASFAFGMATLSQLWNDHSLLQKAYEFIDRMESDIRQDQVYDIVGGSAGALLVCLEIYQLEQNERVLQVANSLGEHLCDYLAQLDLDQQPLLSGFSHGAAGFSTALIKLAHVMDNKRYDEVGKKMLAYEHSLFHANSQNWIDLRQDVKHTHANFWCHGASGIGLARTLLLPTKDQQVQKDLEVAIRQTLRSGFGQGHSMCHGDLGNIDFLISASQVADHFNLKDLVDQCGMQIIEERRKEGWTFGLNVNSELYGFMLGLSGIGYGLLRLWDSSIPSVISLQIPKE
ncbi:type 2 lantipeptide synthetase LanM [Hazenella sp. IB182357]|uniref:Type 2 lantipeptide synthetase LanM n=1 Tax=Polycladospora coralii TaxID=2771432 RepID=A0A926RU88_9BACL|nr:type 2 lanthipeptide synthetase LanM family protein [Polycladospora coralii]MBD1372089.1 type 2 lantipeptide synthetase LanM [Polycladospora coralii]